VRRYKKDEKPRKTEVLERIDVGGNYTLVTRLQGKRGAKKFRRRKIHRRKKK